MTSSIVPSQTIGIRLTRKTSPAVIKPVFGINEGRSLNQDPLPGVVKRPLIAKVTRIPNVTDAAQDAKNIDAMELLTTSTNSSGLPAHEVSSKEYLAALDTARWNSMTIESNIEDSSFLFVNARIREDILIKAKVNPSKGRRIENSIDKNETNIKTSDVKEIRVLLLD